MIRRAGIVRIASRAAAIIAVALLAACGGYDSDIKAVKQAEGTPGHSNEAWANDVAGARGHVEWTADKAVAYNNPDVIEVVANIDRPSANGTAHKVELHFLHNRQTRKIALDNVVVDGKAQGIIGGALNLMLLQLQ
ncbi:MAG: hypothetical protein QOK29_3966 [Rhodospirillaceae bacterium]|nr:hypothetical protein [Rhodospirillaceae bacterium]